MSRASTVLDCLECSIHHTNFKATLGQYSIFGVKMKISALLNPSPDTHHRRRSSRTRRLTNEASPVDDSSDYVPGDTSRKSKGKQTKDAPKFERGEVVGTVNFPPHDTFSADIAKHLKDFKIFPSTGISAYPRHIPYSSDKKDFLMKTGRDSFEGKSSVY